MADSKPPEKREEQQQKKWFETTQGQILLSVGGLAIYLLFGLVLWWVLDRYINPQDSGEKKDLVQALGLIMAGVAGAVGIYFTWRGQRITQEGLQENLRLTEQTQITERFTRAIDQLGATDDDGNPRLEIRLGGIYALERIDKESPERAYHRTVVEVLTAYVRENAPWPPKASKSSEEGFIKPPGEGSVSDSAASSAAEQDRGTEQGAEPAQGAPSTDIQAILDVLNRRENRRAPETHLPHLELQGANLQGANLQGANLRGANLRGAYLRGAYLEGAHLEGARLHGANLQAAYLQGTHLERVRLLEANLQGAIGLTQEQIEVAFGDETTTLPEDLHLPAHWSQSTSKQPNGDE